MSPTVVENPCEGLGTKDCKKWKDECIFSKRKCRQLGQAQMCADYEDKQKCKSSHKPKKTYLPPATDGNNGKCVYYVKGDVKQCRPIVETKCTKMKYKTAEECKENGCNVKTKKGGEYKKCMGIRDLP